VVEIRTGTARSGDLDLYYEDMGDEGDPAVLLIMGLGAQLLLWRQGFCEKLVGQGLRVIRYDNRDAGLSSKLDGVKPVGPLLPKLARTFLAGRTNPGAYALEDMADDAGALLDQLGIPRAHIVGASMGGMIAQVFAARHADRTAGLGILFSSNNQPLLPPPAPRALLAVVKGSPAGASRERVVQDVIRARRIMGSPMYPAPTSVLRADAKEAYDRSYYPEGVARQFEAILASGSLLDYDRQITAPTVVIHGLSDKLMRPAGGRAIAAAIRGARMVQFDGMGHELPEDLWDQVVDELKTTFAEAS
jgi:pimeloyl-ACP methyl ester carboxylesterase